MARLVGLSVVMVTLVVAGRWLGGIAPEASAASTQTDAAADLDADAGDVTSGAGDPAPADGADPATDQPDLEPPDALPFTRPRPHVAFFDELDIARWASGIYSVGDSTDPDIADADRDVRPKVDGLAVDERLNGDVFGDYTGSQRGEIVPGLYSTDFDATDCGYELWHVARKSRAAELIGEEYLAEGRLLVTINGIEPDWFIADHDCGDWYQWQPRPEPLAPAATGDYWVGDLAPGRWLVPDGCLWEQTVAFRGALLRDVAASGQGPDLIEVTDEPMGLRLRSCRTPITFID